jgi:hypothetical protein
LIALRNESLYLYSFGSASVSRIINCQATRARRGFRPALTSSVNSVFQSGKSISNGS